VPVFILAVPEEIVRTDRQLDPAGNEDARVDTVDIVPAEESVLDFPDLGGLVSRVNAENRGAWVPVAVIGMLIWEPSNAYVIALGAEILRSVGEKLAPNAPDAIRSSAAIQSTIFFMVPSGCLHFQFVNEITCSLHSSFPGPISTVFP
jgi:hypothetical protein